MTENKLKEFTLEELENELARRRAQSVPMDMTALETSVLDEEKQYGNKALQARLDNLPKETGTSQKCPRCGRKLPVKARQRRRKVQTMSGEVVLYRDYYYCPKCRHGFYPRDEDLGLPTKGTLSREMERRVLDFALNDPYACAAERWNLHFHNLISSNLLRGVVDRVGSEVEECHQAAVHYCLKAPPAQPAKTLVVQTDGSMLPTRGTEPWKESKLAVLFRAEHWLRGTAEQHGILSQKRYVGVLGNQQGFAAVLDIALRMERSLQAETVVWVADGALGNWRLAEQLAPNCVQILDYYHAMEHAMDCAKVLLGEKSPYLTIWQKRIEELLFAHDPQSVLQELEQCLFLAPRKGRGAIKKLLAYYRNNNSRMHYRHYHQKAYPLGSGIVESAHRHVLQRRMKNAGQHWSIPKARTMVALRTAYRTAGPQDFHRALLRAKQLSTKGTIPHWGPVKRRASNRDSSRHIVTHCKAS